MEELKLQPYGEIKKTPKWNTNTVKFESGASQKQQRQVLPDVTWSFVFSGLQEERDELEAFFERHAGDVKRFYFTIDGKKEVVRFANDNLNFKIVREAGRPIAYAADVVLERVKAKVEGDV